MQIRSPPDSPYDIDANDAAYLRRILGLSRGRFGELVGVTVETVYGWERSDSQPGYRPKEAMHALWDEAKREGVKSAADRQRP